MKKQNPPRLKLLLSATVLAGASLLPLVVTSGNISAAQITARSLTLQTGTTPSDVNSDSINDGGSMPGGTANHLFQFTVPSASNVDAILFEYCTTAASVTNGIQCNAPAGLDASSSALGNDGGTGWSITNQTANTVTVSGTAIPNPGLQGAKTFRLDDVVNPTTTNATFFVRITTYTGGTGGTSVDNGTVAASTANAIELSGTMPESLVFCTGATVGTTAGVPDCTTATAGDVEFDKLFTPQDTAFATSQMAASTNAGTGYIITVAGPTMTSGSNTIGAIGGTEEAPILGKVGGQFGLNLVANTTPNIPDSANIAPATNGTNYFGQALNNFDTDGLYAFNASGNNSVADSNSSGTDAQIYTVSYIVNVPGSQPAGTYTTTLTYIATPYF